MQKLILILLLIPGIVPAQEPSVLFTKQINNNDNIYLINPKGELQQITDHNRKDSSPVLSPDGIWMVFTSERAGWWKIWKMNLNTKEAVQLTYDGAAAYSPSWSTDGSRIVFVNSKDGNQEIYTMDKNGKTQINITKSGEDEMTPYWGKDNKIYYAVEIDGYYQLARINPDGSQREILTTGKNNKLMPQLSNDFSKLLYYGDEDGNLEIYILELSTQKIIRLTRHPLMDMRPRWSPDNTEIVFERGNKGNNHHIFMMDSNGKNVRQLTFSNYNYAPSYCIR